MPLLIRYQAECECGGTMSVNELDLTQDGSAAGDAVVINLDMLGEMVIECGTCADKAWVPNVGDLIQDVED